MCRLAKSCLEAQKHVILEKPMAASYAEAKDLCSIARSQDKLLAVYHNRQVIAAGAGPEPRDELGDKA